MRTLRCRAEDLSDLMEADMVRLDRRIKVGVAKAAIDGAHAIEPNIPVAFAELRGSLHVDATKALTGRVYIILDAPHAAAVERGSRPHTPPLEPLIRWVKLRGMQGLDKRGNLRTPTRRAWGNTTAANAFMVAASIKQLERGLRVTNINAPEKIARAIQASIKKNGTRPHWMVRSSLGRIEVVLGQNLNRAVHGDD